MPKIPLKSSQAHMWKASCRNYRIHLHTGQADSTSVFVDIVTGCTFCPAWEGDESCRDLSRDSMESWALVALQTHHTCGCASTRLLCWGFKHTEKCWALKCFHRLQLWKPFTSHRQPAHICGGWENFLPARGARKLWSWQSAPQQPYNPQGPGWKNFTSMCWLS